MELFPCLLSSNGLAEVTERFAASKFASSADQSWFFCVPIYDCKIGNRGQTYAIRISQRADVCMVSDSLAKAERERAFFSSRYGQTVEIVAIEDGGEASAQLQRQLAIRNPRDHCVVLRKPIINHESIA